MTQRLGEGTSGSYSSGLWRGGPGRLVLLWVRTGGQGVADSANRIQLLHCCCGAKKCDRCEIYETQSTGPFFLLSPSCLCLVPPGGVAGKAHVGFVDKAGAGRVSGELRDGGLITGTVFVADTANRWSRTDVPSLLGTGPHNRNELECNELESS